MTNLTYDDNTIDSNLNLVNNNTTATSVTKTPPPSIIKLDNSNTNVLTNYHVSEIAQNKVIIGTAISLTIGGALVIAIAIISGLLTNSNFSNLTLISGVLLEFLSGGIYWLFSKSNQSKQNYFRSISKQEEFNKIISMIEKTSDEKTKNKLKTRLVESYCKCNETNSNT